MRKHLSEILLTLLTVALLVGFAFAVPHPAITDAAHGFLHQRRRDDG